MTRFYSVEHRDGPIQLERAEVIESRHATHLRYRILLAMITPDAPWLLLTAGAGSA